MIARVLPAVVATIGSYVIGKAARHLAAKVAKSMADEPGPKKSSAPKDLGTLDYDADSNSYRPKS